MEQVIHDLFFGMGIGVGLGAVFSCMGYVVHSVLNIVQRLIMEGVK